MTHPIEKIKVNGKIIDDKGEIAEILTHFLQKSENTSLTRFYPQTKKQRTTFPLTLILQNLKSKALAR